MAARKFQNPKGTRDFYPQDMLRRRYVTEAWRAVSLRHGFEEIDGPTFEHLDLYTVKSGEEIVSQLFSFQRAGGDDTYALRPEFTPTLARMYAAQASTLPKPVRWFSVLPYFRAERPQRGRLREFLQWNCDVIGGSPDQLHDFDAEVMAACVGMIELMGLLGEDVRLKFGSRGDVRDSMMRHGIDASRRDMVFALLDTREKVPPEEFVKRAEALGLPDAFIQLHHPLRGLIVPLDLSSKTLSIIEGMKIEDATGIMDSLTGPGSLGHAVRSKSLASWCEFDSMIIRGLAYYTGTVFEVIAEGERAVAGGGRYDNLIELLGGPPTPAVGFAMGDVVLTNLLDDKGLMPGAGGDEAELPEAVESMLRAQRVRPEIFVVSGAEEDDQHVVPLVARLRRGIEREDYPASGARPWQTAQRYSVRPLHARTTDKSTRNLKKLLADAQKQGARFAAVIHGPDKVQLKDLDAREDLPDNFSIDPGPPDDPNPTYVGRVVTQRLDH